MKKKRLSVAIQAALLSMVVGNASAAPVTADNVGLLDAPAVSELVLTDVEGLDADLIGLLIAQVAEVEIDDVGAEVANFLINNNDPNNPEHLTGDQLDKLQEIVDASTPTEDVIDVKLGSDTEPMVIELNETEVIDFSVLSEDNISTLLDTFASFTLDELKTSGISAELAQFLLDNNPEPPILSLEA